MAGQTLTAEFEFEKDTKNTRRYAEVDRPGQPPIIGTLYLAKWAANSARRLRLTVEVLE